MKVTYTHARAHTRTHTHTPYNNNTIVYVPSAHLPNRSTHMKVDWHKVLCSKCQESHPQARPPECCHKVANDTQQMKPYQYLQYASVYKWVI